MLQCTLGQAYMFRNRLTETTHPPVAPHYTSTSQHMPIYSQKAPAPNPTSLQPPEMITGPRKPYKILKPYSLDTASNGIFIVVPNGMLKHRRLRSGQANNSDGVQGMLTAGNLANS